MSHPLHTSAGYVRPENQITVVARGMLKKQKEEKKKKKKQQDPTKHVFL